ncbi:hypothetical protein [Cupriavidus pauculus]|uniref:hypothetical protein n=1 Tax=Cupriavidus pauculus TaxID=82633 RepID=UPI00385736BB
MTTKTQPHCSTCDSTDILMDANAQWNADSQEWILKDVYGDDIFCRHCEEECRPNWKDA